MRIRSHEKKKGTESMQTEAMKLYGLTSESCIDKVMQALEQLAGVNDVVVSLLRSRVIVCYDETRTVRSHMERVLRQAGYDVCSWV